MVEACMGGGVEGATGSRPSTTRPPTRAMTTTVISLLVCLQQQGRRPHACTHKAPNPSFNPPCIIALSPIHTFGRPVRQVHRLLLPAAMQERPRGHAGTNGPEEGLGVHAAADAGGGTGEWWQDRAGCKVGFVGVACPACLRLVV